MGLAPLGAGGVCGLGPSWSWRDLWAWSPLEAGEDAWDWPLLELEKSHGHGSHLERKIDRGLGPLTELEKRHMTSPLPEQETRRGLAPFKSGSGGVDLELEKRRGLGSPHGAR